MKIKKFHVDAFTDKLFAGNPAAVCMLDSFLDDEMLARIAAEHNLAETAFVVKGKDSFHIRWFTPTVEVELCGHATLAAAYVIFNHTNHQGDVVQFQTQRSGKLHVMRSKEKYILDFPSDEPMALDKTGAMDMGIENEDFIVLKGRTKYLVILNSEKEIRELKPNLKRLRELELEGVIYSAPGESADFVSRFFCPKIGIDEDPVTGSAHTVLIPYWAKRLNKTDLSAEQLSARGGNIVGSIQGDRIHMAGSAILYSEGEIFI